MKHSTKVTISILVVALLFGSVGAFTLMGRKSAKSPTTPVDARTLTNPTAVSPTKAFSGMEGMKVKYPSLWIAVPAATNATNSQQKIVAFQSPSTMTETTTLGDEKVVHGAKIILLQNKFSQTKSVEEFKNSDNFIWKYAKNKSESVINGNPVLQFDASYEGSQRHYAVFYRDGREYMMILDEEVYKKDEQKTVFDNMLKNLEFNKSP